MNRFVVGVIILAILALLAVLIFTGDTGGSKSSVAKTKPSVKEEVVENDYTREEILTERTKLLKARITDNYLGSVHAPVLIIEYASLSCGHCATFHNEVLPKIKEQFIDTNKVRFVYRDYPLNAPALRAAQLSQCIDKDKYYGFLGVLFKSQNSWAFNRNYMDILKNIAKIAGIEQAEFTKCVNDKALQEKIIKATKDAGQFLEVESTPTLFINGVKYDGKRNIEEISAYINKVLKGEAL